MRALILFALLAGTASAQEASPTPTPSSETATETAAVKAPAVAKAPGTWIDAVAKAPGIWIDVRTTEEYEAGHISDALHIPVADIVAGVEKLNLKKDAPIHVYCKLGIRAQAAKEALEAAGYSNVTNQGGYQDLIQRGLR